MMNERIENRWLLWGNTETKKYTFGPYFVIIEKKIIKTLWIYSVMHISLTSLTVFNSRIIYDQ